MYRNTVKAVNLEVASKKDLSKTIKSKNQLNQEKDDKPMQVKKQAKLLPENIEDEDM